MDADRLLDAIGEIGGDLILDAEAMPATVSYTHLDVYKRQP